MPRRTKPAKAKARAKPARPAPTREGARVRDLEKRLAEALKREAEALGKLQTRDRELAEAVEQQTATAEILRVMSSTPTDLQPVMDAVAAAAARLCGAIDAIIRLVEGGTLRIAAQFGYLTSPDAIRPISRDYP